MPKDEAAARMDDTLLRMLKTPPKPRKQSKDEQPKPPKREKKA